MYHAHNNNKKYIQNNIYIYIYIYIYILQIKSTFIKIFMTNI